MNAGVGQVKGEADVIFFDAAGTLIHLARPVGWHYALIARKHGLKVDEAPMESAFREAWRARPARPPSTGPREDDDRPWWRALALDVLRAASPSTCNIDGEAWFAELYTHFAQPGVWLQHAGERLKVLAAETAVGSGPPGTVLDDRLTIACGEGALRPLLLQRPGRAHADTASFLRGYPLPAGTRLN